MHLKRMTGGLLAAILALASVGCGGLKDRTTAGDTEWKTTGEAMILWAEASTAKIKQDDNGEAVKTAEDKQVLRVHMARNESEGAQLMLYARKDIDSYEVSVTDLASSDGIIPSDAVTIYQIKYQTAEAASEGNPEFAEGKIPDPMLPFETAGEYRENVIKQGENQAIFLDVKTETSTPAGVYTAAISVKTEEETYRFPMEVTVHDVTYPDTAGLKTAFSWFDRDVFATAELDASDEQTTAYFETLLSYNMSSFLPFEGVGGAKSYCEMIRKYYDYPGFSAYRLYYDTGATVYNGKAAPFNAELLKQYLEEIVAISLEDRVNYLDKAYTYFYTVADEPNTDDKFQKAKDSLTVFETLILDADSELREKYAGTADYMYYVSVISDTLTHIPNVLPGTLDLTRVKSFEIENYTLCPLINAVDKESNRASWRAASNSKELWSYLCVVPKYPYPSAHTDDYTLGLRLVPWMCYDYDFDAFLYWSVASYVLQSNGDVVADPWETMETGNGRPGDAKFFYPGAKYGLDNPCPSLRAIAWRDGVDDYSLLQAAADIYSEYGMDAGEVLKSIFADLYTGSVPITESAIFEEARIKVFALVESLKHAADIVFTGVDIEFCTAEVKLKQVDESAILLVDGKEQKPDEEGNYSFEIDLTKQTTFKYTVKCNGKKTNYSRDLVAGILGVVNGFEQDVEKENLFSSSTAGYHLEANDNADYIHQGKQSLHMVLNPEKQDTLPYFAIMKDSELIGGSWSNVKNFVFYMYNAGAEDCEMKVTHYITGETTVAEVTLESGKWTQVNIAMPADVANVESIQEFDFNFPQGSAVDLYIDSYISIVEGGAE